VFQPIHYALIAMIISGAYAFMYQEPLAFILVLLIAQNQIGRFDEPDPELESDDAVSQPMGFTADVK
jgi:hypothetical protein